MKRIGPQIDTLTRAATSCATIVEQARVAVEEARKAGASLGADAFLALGARPPASAAILRVIQFAARSAATNQKAAGVRIEAMRSIIADATVLE